MRSKWYTKYKLAHRGLHNDKFPENSIGAFKNAMTHGFAIELDVRLLKDNTAVIFHDSNLKRMCGVDKNISDITIDELRDLSLSGSKFTIPTLSEVLDVIDGEVPIMIELKPVKKNKHHILEKTVYRLIKNYKGNLAIKSFNPFAVLWFKKNAPKIIRGMLSSYFKHTYMPAIYKFAVKRLILFNQIKPDFISYDYRYLPNKYVSNKNVPVIAWTITSKELEEEALKFADNIVFERYIPKNTTTYNKKATK